MHPETIPSVKDLPPPRRLDRWRQFLRPDSGPWSQFIKYAVAGGVATGVHVGIFYVLSIAVLSALRPDDPVARFLGLRIEPFAETIRVVNATINNWLAFLVANLIAYLLNIAMVFRAGRHARWLEILMFYGVSAISVFFGTALMGLLIQRFGIHTTPAFGANILTSLMLNFLVRKYLIFH